MRRINFKVDDYKGVRWEPGYFHMFGTQSHYGEHDQVMHSLIAIVEDEDGNVHEIRPRDICFVDDQRSEDVIV